MWVHCITSQNTCTHFWRGIGTQMKRSNGLIASGTNPICFGPMAGLGCKQNSGAYLHKTRTNKGRPNRHPDSPIFCWGGGRGADQDEQAYPAH